MKDYVVFDLETTGFSAEVNEIIEIGAYKVQNGVVIDKFCTFVRPILYIPITVQQITGIFMEDVSDAEPVEVVLNEFFTWCEGYSFLGHNLKFDYEFLLRKGKKSGLDFSLNGERSGVCTLNASKKLLSLKSYKLQDVASYLGIDLNGGMSYHRAPYDAMITKLIYDRLLYKFSSLDLIAAKSLTDNKAVYGEASCNEVLDFE